MDFTAYDITLVPVIVILVEIVKRAGVPARWLPLFSIGLGQGGAFIYIAPGDAKQAVLVGLVMAFSSMGLWSGAKNTLGK